MRQPSHSDLKNLATLVSARRHLLELSEKTLADWSAVHVSVVRRFEKSAIAAPEQLMQICFTLQLLPEFDQLFY